MARVCFMDCRLPRTVRYSSIAPRLTAEVDTNAAARGMTSAGWRNSVNTAPAGQHASVVATPSRSPSTSPRWMPSAAASWSRAPMACDTTGSTAHTTPMPKLCNP